MRNLRITGFLVFLSFLSTNICSARPAPTRACKLSSAPYCFFACLAALREIGCRFPLCPRRRRANVASFVVRGFSASLRHCVRGVSSACRLGRLVFPGLKRVWSRLRPVVYSLPSRQEFILLDDARGVAVENVVGELRPADLRQHLFLRVVFLAAVRAVVKRRMDSVRAE